MFFFYETYFGLLWLQYFHALFIRAGNTFGCTCMCVNVEPNQVVQFGSRLFYLAHVTLFSFSDEEDKI